MPRKLTERQRRFVDAYLVSRNAKQAALDAGYSPRWPQMSGHQVLKLPHIRAALRARGIDPPHGAHPATQLRKKMVRLPRKELSIREEKFALAYLVTGNAALAARRAGIRTALSHRDGHRLLNRPRVAAFIEAERAASIERTRIDADRVRREFARLAFVDIADVIEWDEEGNIALKASASISPDDRAAIAELKVKRGAHGMKARVKLHDKQRALDSLARLMGLYGKKNFVTIDHARERRDANAILRERLLKIARAGEKNADEKKE
jgi:phage terminase small subunit